MKKNYFMLALASMMMAACANNDLVDDLVKEEVPQAIGFETFSNKISRKVADATKLDSYHDAFGVWAYKTVGTEKTVMENYQVLKPNWTYAGVGSQTLKYWDKQATKYSFYAYAPYRASGVSIAAGKIKIEDGTYAATENLQSGLWQTTINDNKFTTDTDWMIADGIPNYTTFGTEVPEVFKHIMSKLIVILQSDDVATGAEVEVTSVSINNVHGKGSYDGDNWTASDGGNSIPGEVGKLTSTDGYYSMEYLLIPSEDDPTFSITYKVNGDTYTVTNATISNIAEFKANTCYTLTATIGLSPIKFTASAVDFTTPGTGGSVSIQ